MQPDTSQHAHHTDAFLPPAVEHHWNITELEKVPQTYPVDADGLKPAPGITPIFFDGVDFRGMPTRVFAWIGIPANSAAPATQTAGGVANRAASAGAANSGVPGIVLVHGGGGTAFHDWVKLWMDRGYAAIAIDTCGAFPSSTEGMGDIPRTRHAHAGAPFGGGGFANALAPVEDQWPYHAVAAIIRANSLLRAQPGVDPERVGVNGISWGGVLTQLAAGADERFAFAVSVYGSGFLGEDSHWKNNELHNLPPATAQKWLDLWDPGQTQRVFKMPVLFVNGTNDKHFRPLPWQKTIHKALANGADVTRSLQVRLPHGHPPAGDPPEVRAFADAVAFGTPALPQITVQPQARQGDRTVTTSWTASAQRPVKSVQIVYTADEGSWPERRWIAQDVRIAKQSSLGGRAQGSAKTEIPARATACYFNLYNTDGHVVSSALWQR